MSERFNAVNARHDGDQSRISWQDHHFIGGSLCLDFANSLVFRSEPARREDRLRAPGDLEAWASAVGVGIRVEERNPVAFRRLLRLRGQIDRLFRGVATGEGVDRAALAGLLEAYRLALPELPLAATPDGLRPAGETAHGPRPKLTALLLQSAVELAYSPLLARVRACPGCDWLILDRSRNGAKKWCAMRTCGNRAKARRHYRRSRAGGAARGGARSSRP